MIDLILYTKEGCHLCEDVEVMLGELAADHPHTLTTIDIRTDRALHKKHLLTIPVLRIGDTELSAPITREQVVAALTNKERRSPHTVP